jgi:tripartite-type tricarboxylate transporter receptor subunit TctC
VLRPIQRTAFAGLVGMLLVAACAPAGAPSVGSGQPPSSSIGPTAAQAKPTQAAPPEAKSSGPAAPIAGATKPAEKAAPAIDVGKMAAHFEGKSIDLYIGYAPGGGNDIRGRIFAEFFQRYIPGNPTVVVQNMAGGGGVQATRHVMRSKPDGLTMVVIPSGVYLLELLGEKQEGFDLNQPVKLGNYESATPDFGLVHARTSVATSWDEIVAMGKQGRVFRWGAPAVGNSASIAGEWLDMVGAPVKVVYGYGGTNELLAALDRQEVDLINSDPPAETVEASFPRIQKAFPEWLTREPKVITPILATRRPVPQAWLDPWGWKTPPTLLDVVQATDVQKQAYRLGYAVRDAVDPLSLPPGVPDDIYQTLKQAMAQTGSDAEYLAAMKGRGFDGGYRSPDDIEVTLNQLRDAQPETIAILRRMYIGQ